MSDLISNSPARDSKHGRTQRRLLQTATRLFYERGFYGTSIRDISQAAEMAVSAMYYYAETKEELLEAIVIKGLTQFTDGVLTILKDVEGPSERLATVITGHVAFHAHNPRTAGVVDREFKALVPRIRKQVQAQRDAYEAEWSRIIDDAAATGEFVDHDGMARLALLEMCTGVAHWYKQRRGKRIPDLCSLYADMGLSLVRARREDQSVTVADLEIPSVSDFMPLFSIETEPGSR